MASSNSRIIVLGTLSDIDALNSGRTCAGIILDVDNSQILFDPGIGSVVRASQTNIDLSRTNIMLVSSTESVYCNDINAVIEHSKDLHLICPKALLEHDKSILTSIHAKDLKILSLGVDESRQTNIKNIDIQSQYNKSDAISFKVTTSRYVLGYITKARYSRQFVDSFKDSNILVISLHQLKHDKNSRYLDFEEITEMIREINPELVILTGFSKKTLDEDPLDISRRIKQELQKDKEQAIKTQILPARESMIINPESYNIKLKQKSLRGFLG